MNIKYTVNDSNLSSKEFISLANQVWPKDYNEIQTALALAKTINITARNNGLLVGCVRILTDGVYFGTITEILVLPEYQKQGIGTKLMNLVQETTPTKLYFGAQPSAVPFYEKLGIEKGLTAFSINKKKPN